MMVNPSGVQLDMINSAAGNEDSAPDWIWDSAGRAHRHRLRRRNPPAAAEHPLQGRRRHAHGHPVLAPRQPPGRVGGVAGARARRLGVRTPRVAALRRTCSRGRRANCCRASPTGGRETRESPPTLGRRPMAAAMFGFSAKIGLTPDDHARRDRQPRFQPGRERRVPGRSQPALPDLLRREAAVLHGRRRHLRARRRRQRRQQPAHRGAHAADRRSDLRREADGQRRHVSRFGTLSAVDEAVPADAPIRSRKAAASSTSPAPSTVSVRATTSARSPPT